MVPDPRPQGLQCPPRQKHKPSLVPIQRRSTNPVLCRFRGEGRFHAVLADVPEAQRAVLGKGGQPYLCGPDAHVVYYKCAVDICTIPLLADRVVTGEGPAIGLVDLRPHTGWRHYAETPDSQASFQSCAGCTSLGMPSPLLVPSPLDTCNTRGKLRASCSPCVRRYPSPARVAGLTAESMHAIPHDFAEGRVQAFAPCSHCARLQDVEPGFGCGSGRLHMMRNGPSAALLGAGRSIAPSSFLNKCCAPKEFAVESCRDPFSSAAFSSGT